MPDEKQTATTKNVVKTPRKRVKTPIENPMQVAIPTMAPPVPVQVAEDDPGSYLKMAIQAGNVDVIDRLAALYKAWQADKAKAAFVDALVGFQTECPTIKKSVRKTFQSEKTQKLVTYNYAPFDSILDQTRELRGKYRIAHRVEAGHVSNAEGKVLLLTATVVIMVGSHEERTTMAAPPDMTGFKNDIQAEGSTMEYLRRYAVSLALGLATADDLDGDKAKKGEGGDLLEAAVNACKDVETLHALFNEQDSDKRTDPKVTTMFKAREKQLKSK